MHDIIFYVLLSSDDIRYIIYIVIRYKISYILILTICDNNMKGYVTGTVAVIIIIIILVIID